MNRSACLPLKRPGGVQAVEGGVEGGNVAGVAPRRPPVVEAGAEGEAVSEAVGDGEAAGALQLGQHDYHLP